MTKINRITPQRIRQTNRHLIYSCIYEHEDGQVSQQEISRELRMSRPTVASNLSSLEQEGLIFRSGLLDGDMPGRKPVTWSISAEYKIAVGVEIFKHAVKIIAIDLYGRPLKLQKLRIEYENCEAYYERVSSVIKEFINGLGLKDEILGIGFALQGLVSGRVHEMAGLPVQVCA